MVDPNTIKVEVKQPIKHFLVSTIHQCFCARTCYFFSLVWKKSTCTCKSNHQILPNETNAAPDWKMPRPRSVCALPCLMSFSFAQQIVFVCLRLMMNSTSWIEETVLKLPINCYKCTNRILLFNTQDLGRMEQVLFSCLSSVVTLDIVSSSCWWLLFFLLSGRSRMGLFQLLLIHHRLDSCPRARDCLASDCNITWSFYSIMHASTWVFQP